MAKHVYLSKRAALGIHLSKMASAQRKERYMNNRRERISKARQALLMNEYIQTKHFEIYREAAEYYNELNEKYPTKRDLRKCTEFRDWKSKTSGVQSKKRSASSARNTNYHIYLHPAIPIEQQSESPDLSSSEISDLDLPEPPRVQRTANKIMELRIPLLSPSAAMSETVEIVTQETLENIRAEETIDDTTLHPTLEEGLPQDIVDRIIKELRADPELRSIMTDMEQDIEFQQLGIDLNIDEDKRLENELENLQW